MRPQRVQKKCRRLTTKLAETARNKAMNRVTRLGFEPSGHPFAKCLPPHYLRRQVPTPQEVTPVSRVESRGIRMVPCSATLRHDCATTPLPLNGPRCRYCCLKPATASSSSSGRSPRTPSHARGDFPEGVPRLQLRRTVAWGVAGAARGPRAAGRTRAGGGGPRRSPRGRQGARRRTGRR